MANDARKPGPDRRHFLKWAAGAGAGALAAGVGSLAIPGVQRKMIYRPKKDFSGNDLPPLQDPKEYGLQNVVAEELATSAGDTFVSWHTQNLEPGKKTLVLFAGNGGHLGASPKEGPNGEKLGGDGSAYVNIIKEAQKQGYQVVAVQPVGFAGSNTSPTQKNMFAGAEKTIDWLLEQGLQPGDMHIAGFSMGTTLAAHAANHLSQSPAFRNNSSQQIRLVMVNGYINIQAGIDAAIDVPVVEQYLQAVMHDTLDTGKELHDMAISGHERRIKVMFMRGRDDALTPASEMELHQQAAHGINVRAKEVPGRHFVDPAEILQAFKELDAPGLPRDGSAKQGR